jgi:cation diffusion facilitator CzcD-associated flavoprotein CzcO
MKRTTPEKYHSILIPSYHLGQKRRVFDTDYLACLNRENVYLTNDLISHLTPTSVVTASSIEYPADVVILANGFHTQSFILPMRFVNATRGISLDSSPETGVWRDTGPEAYLGKCPLSFECININRMLRFWLSEFIPFGRPKYNHGPLQCDIHI